MRSRAIAGFTLVEMMIVVAIIGILAAIAYPSYREHVLRGNRAEGMALLNDAAARQERYFAQTNTYVTAQADIGKLGFTASGESFQVTSSTGKYSLAVSAPNDAGGYLLTATPQGAQAADTKCGNLTLNAKGTRGISATSTAVSDCWR